MTPRGSLRPAAGVGRWIRDGGKLLLSARVRRDALWEWRRRLRGVPRLPPGPIRRVLVVCQGNLCRSPFAAALLAAGRSDLVVRSAGLAAGEGDPVDGAALRVSRRLGVLLDGHRTHRLGVEDVDWSELIVCMEGHQMAQIARLGSEHARKARLLGDFLPGPPHRIQDPWGRSDEVYAATFERIGLAIEKLSSMLKRVEP